jgi:1-phosphofructokinase family hexose kinase
MKAMIVALNPSVDLEWRVDQVRWEEKNVIQSERRWAGGKGINVARWLQFLGGAKSARLLLPLGGSTGKEMATCLHGEKLPFQMVPIRQPTRVNVIVTATVGGQMRFNPPGPQLSLSEWRTFLRSAEQALSKSGVLVLSGSLPRGVSVDAYAQLVQRGHRARVKTVADCDGAALAAVAGAGPFLVKPNVHELAQWWRRPLLSESTIQRAASKLSERTGGWVLVSRGPQGGLLLNAAYAGYYRATVPRIKPVNTVGAGDAMLAAVVRQIGLKAEPEEWLRWGVAVGTAATQCAAGLLPQPRRIEKIVASIPVRRVR